MYNPNRALIFQRWRLFPLSLRQAPMIHSALNILILGLYSNFHCNNSVLLRHCLSSLSVRSAFHTPDTVNLLLWLIRVVPRNVELWENLAIGAVLEILCITSALYFARVRFSLDFKSMTIFVFWNLLFFSVDVNLRTGIYVSKCLSECITVLWM